jgi:hypothetical protein
MSDKLKVMQELANRNQQNSLQGNSRVVFDELVKRGEIKVPPQYSPLKDRLKGSAEAMLTFATGMPAQAVGGVAGLGDLAYNLVTGNENALDKAVTTMENVSSALIRRPKSEEGQQVLEMLSAPFELFGEVTQAAGNKALQETGSPAIATAVQVGLEYLPGAFGLKKVPKQVKERGADLRTLKDTTDETGVSLKGNSREQQGQIVSAADNILQAQTKQGSDLLTVQNAVKRAAENRKKATTYLYDQATERGNNASVGTARVGALSRIIKDTLKDYDIADMPKLSKRLKELDTFASLPTNFSIKVNALSAWRKRINKNSSTDPAEATALGIAKGQLDEYMNDMLESDLISGDPAAITAWKDANRAFTQYKEDFSDVKVVKRLTEQGTTPEQVKSLILGQSALNAKKEAGLVVRKLNEVLGKDSEPMNHLRSEVVFDVVEPLLRDQPNYNAFTSGYDKFVRNNKTLITELFGEEGVKDLGRLRSITAAVSRNPSSKFTVDVESTVSRLVAGNSLSRNAAKMSLITKGLKAVKGTMKASRQRKLMADVLGYDPKKSLIPLTPLAVQSGVQTTRQINEEQQPPQQ